MGAMAGERIAVVTGASRGIGHAVAMELARQGARVIAVARSLEALANQRGNGFDERIVPHACDLGDIGASQALADRVSPFGRLDILVSNAATMGPRVNLGALREDDWRGVMAANVDANWRLIRDLGPLLQRSDAPRAVFLTSGSGSRLAPGRGAYAISKAALDAIVRTWAAEAEGTSLRVMLVNPGPTRTDMRASIKPDEDPMTLPAPAELAPKIAAMCSPDWRENGLFYDFPRDALLRYREPA